MDHLIQTVLINKKKKNLLSSEFCHSGGSQNENKRKQKDR